MNTPRTAPPRPTLVVGLGSADRGDDAVGGHVARAVAALADPRVVVLEHEDPTDLIELWTGHDDVDVVVVDATCSGAPAGTLRLLETGSARPPLAQGAWARTGRGGTHAFGLAAAVELARVLGRLPERVTVVGVEAGTLEAGSPLSAAVVAAVPRAVDAVLAAVSAGAEGAAGTAGAVRERGSSRVPR